MAATAALVGLGSAKPIIEQVAEHSADEKPYLVGVAIPMTAVSISSPAIPEVVEEGGDIKVTGDFICIPAPEVCQRIILLTGEKDAHVLNIGSERLQPLTRAIHPGSGLDEFRSSGLKLDDFKATDDEILDNSAAAPLWRNLRVLLAAAQVGNARAATRTAWRYSEERFQTGRIIIEHQEVKRTLENMNEQTMAMFGMVRLAAGAPDGDAANKLARRAYTYAGTLGELVCLDAIQSHGGYGYMKDYGVEKRTRDAKSLQCLLGTYPEDILGGD